MDFGVLMMIRNPPQFRRPDSEVYQSYMDRAVQAEKLGFAHAWCSEHHFAEDGWSPSQLPVLAAVAARTERIRLGTYIFLLPFHNPIRVAEDVATVDIISNGRFDLGVGPGAHPREFATFGIPLKQRRPRMYEALEIIKKCFNENEFSFEGKYFQYRNVRMTTKPVQRELPIWIGAIGEKALFEAGAHGYNLCGGPTAKRVRIYQDGRKSAGFDPKRYQSAVLQMFHLAETHDKAWDEAERFLHYQMSWHYALFASEENLKKVHSDVDLNVPPVGELRKSGKSYFGRALVGSPDEINRMLDDQLKRAPTNELVISTGLPGMDPRHASNALELFAREVMPNFRGC